ncbi:hypothetical protein THASP1DRAFT_19209 [Thamnocephalis sphaerospora]|uniref:Uncharacterized protein n=1 Tax=Thamnocephalis sphaerospora TaxID=78915 RepID=A0A4P9XKE1_9FUNG|nr:hypothetical protein THASP1DRAFT_19209 [Thamnocephalis sphaerospora]|eukprot:RKP05881.1 hypothetical protein THASP1DRAFT_19209 [Thamnocephalis sphaerospora]
MTQEDLKDASADAFFSAIRAGDAEPVRALLATDRTLTTRRQRGDHWQYSGEHALDAYKFLGAYVGAVTGLHAAMLLGHESIAKDIIDVTFGQGKHRRRSDGNTALHLAVFLGLGELVTILLDRGASVTLKNGKGLTPVDVSDRPEILALLQEQ